MSKKPTRPAAGRTRTARVPSVPRPSVPRPRPGSGRTLAQTRTSPISAIGALVVVGVVLLAGLGYGYATRTEAQTAVDQKVVKQLPLSSATAVCQGMFYGGGGDSFPELSAFTPGAATAGPKDSLTATYADQQAFAGWKSGAPGARSTSGPVSNPHMISDGQVGLPRPVPVVFDSRGAYAPGFAAGLVLRSDTTQPRGLAATPCTAPSTDFWFSGISLGKGRDSKLELTNVDDTPATVNLTFYGPDGPIDTGVVGHDVAVPPHSSREDTLSGFVPPQSGQAVVGSVHVTTSGGRVAAAVLDEDLADPKDKNATGRGMDFIPAQPPAAPDQPVQVIAGIPAGGTGKLPKIDLTLTATGTTAATLEKLEWAGKSLITVSPPAGQNTGSGYTPLAFPLTVPAGKTITVDLSWLPADKLEAGSIRLTTSGGPLLSGVRVVAYAPSGSLTDTAYLGPAQQLTGQAVVVDDKSGGSAVSMLYLTDFGGKGGTVQVTTVGADGKPSAPDPVQIPAGTTIAYPMKGTGEYAAIVDVQPGSDPVYAVRQMSDVPKGNVTTTLQTLEPARLTVGVPPVAADLSGAVKR